MYRIALVDDEKIFTDQIEEYIRQYQAENPAEFQVSVFHSSTEFIAGFQKEYDLILLDVEMPELNGMELAHKIRETDEQVVLMFITNMAQYAIHGYSVGALDFVTKPINYYTFTMKLTRALKRVPKKESTSILLTIADGVKRIDIKQIYYLEVQNRLLHYHTEEGEFVVRGSLQAAEERLSGHPFEKCNHWYLVNLMHVKEVRKNIVVVGSHELEISRRNKTSFLKALTDYMGGNYT